MWQKYLLKASFSLEKIWPCLEQHELGRPDRALLSQLEFALIRRAEAMKPGWEPNYIKNTGLSRKVNLLHNRHDSKRCSIANHNNLKHFTFDLFSQNSLIIHRIVGTARNEQRDGRFSRLGGDGFFDEICDERWESPDENSVVGLQVISRVLGDPLWMKNGSINFLLWGEKRERGT